eukprot:2719828-Amphidinium_carterae.2
MRVQYVAQGIKPVVEASSVHYTFIAKNSWHILGNGLHTRVVCLSIARVVVGRCRGDGSLQAGGNGGEGRLERVRGT